MLRTSWIRMDGRCTALAGTLRRSATCNARTDGQPDMYCIHYHLGAVHAALAQREKAREHFLKQLEHPNTREAALAQQALREPSTRR